MNIARIGRNSSSTTGLIQEALDSLHASTGIVGRRLTASSAADGRISLQVGGKTLHYDCEVKQMVDRFMVLEDLKARSIVNETTLLVCPVLSSALSARCHALGIQFIDTAGNAYITDGAGILISVTGRKRGTDSPQVQREATMTPAALRLLFAALAEPSILNAPYRDISSTVQISTGAIAKAFDTLETRGLIATTPSGTRLIRSPASTISEWATGYIHRIRPKNKKLRFASDRTDELWKTWSPEFRESAWGGEVAAEIVTGHLNPSTFTLYIEPGTRKLPDLIKRFRLRADPAGAIEVIEPFWNMDRLAGSFPTVPLHLVYADLLATLDSRNLSVAEQVFKRAVDHVHDSQRQAA